MNENPKFKQIWGFRRNVDTSSDGSGKVQEKASLIPGLVSPENDHVTETDNPHVEVEKKPKRASNTRKRAPNTPKRARNTPKRACNAPKTEKKNMQEVKSKPKKDACVTTNIKKRGINIRKTKTKFISQMTVSDDLRVFTASILDDLRVARETMFAKMKEEMDQLMNSTQHSRSRKQKGSKINTPKKPSQKPRARKPAKPKQKTELAASNGLDPPQEQPQEQGNNPNQKDPSSKNPILIDSPAEKPIFSNGPNQTITSITSSYLTLASVPSSERKTSVLIDSHAKKPIFTNAFDRVATSSYLTVPVVLPNDKSLKFERGNCSGVQGQEERFRSYGHNNVESSYAGNGNPIGLLKNHQRFDNSNNFGFEDFSQDGSVVGASVMNGGIRYGVGLSGNSMPNHLASSGFCSLYPN